VKLAIPAIVAALAAVIAVNVGLLLFSGDRHDPVGRLSPVARIQLPKAHPTPAPVHAEDD
jgi:hypothetical protein